MARRSPSSFLLPFLPLIVGVSMLVLTLASLQIASAAPSMPDCVLKLDRANFSKLRCIAPHLLQDAYEQARTQITTLKDDKIKACWRQPWEELRNKFLSIYMSRTDWNLAPQSLYRAAECQEALARCSHLGEDYRLAMGLYRLIDDLYPQSARADDGLLAAAMIAAKNLGDKKSARDDINKILTRHASDDSAKAAQELLASLDGKATKVAATTTPTLNTIRWETPSKEQVNIDIGFSAPATVTAKLVDRAKNRKAIVLDISSADVIGEIRRGIAVRNSILNSVKVNQPNKNTKQLVLEFDGVRSYSLEKRNNARLFVLSVDNRKQQVAKGRPARAKTTPVAMALQLERSVRTIVIDAGHGGRDPGTMHNGIVERSTNLDVALRLGRLLQDNGFRVIYTRKSNRYLSLVQRTNIANENRADLFISIHVNAHHNPKVSGLEVYYLDSTSLNQDTRVADRENGSTKAQARKLRKVALTSRVLESRKFALDTSSRMKRRVQRSGYNVNSNGVKTGPFVVLGSTRMPSILVEVGYCTNSREAKLLANPHYRQAIAAGIAEGVMAYRDRDLNRVTAERSKKTRIR